MILLAIASQVAFFVAGKNGKEAPSREAEELLKSWGFSNELDAVRYDQTVAQTESFRIGYNWAMHQDKDYLLTHFGIYRDSCGTESWGKAAKKKRGKAVDEAEEGRKRLFVLNFDGDLKASATASEVLASILYSAFPSRHTSSA